MEGETHSKRPRYAVAVVGGATAGAEAAAILAENGILCAVFEQNVRPYGKIEDGLPRWHTKLREKEYRAIDRRLDHPLVRFVPRTRVGVDVGLESLAREWGFTAVILANGAWSDRLLPVPGAADFVGRGLVYQNSFIFWFNHFPEPDYSGPEFRARQGAVVIGGGLASIDVVKALQIEAVRACLGERGIEEEMLRIEHLGIPVVLAEHGLKWEDLGLRPAALYYRRRVTDMPLADLPPDADDARRAKVGATRRKILQKAMQKYCFDVHPERVPVEILNDGKNLTGLRFQHTNVVDGRAVPIDGRFEEIDTPLVVSSIGSIPAPMPGVECAGEFYRFADRELGRLEGFDSVFCTGNVVTGKGNIKESRKHSVGVTRHIVESYLGIGGAVADAAPPAPANVAAREHAEKVAGWAGTRAPMDDKTLDGLLRRVHDRQKSVGFSGSYSDWIERVAPGPV